MYSLNQAYDQWKQEKIDKCQAIKKFGSCFLTTTMSCFSYPALSPAPNDRRAWNRLACISPFQKNRFCTISNKSSCCNNLDRGIVQLFSHN